MDDLEVAVVPASLVISERAEEISEELTARAEPTSPPPELVNAVRNYLSEQRRQELLRQVAEIEAFLGFNHEHDVLAARIAKIEAFLGMK